MRWKRRTLGVGVLLAASAVTLLSLEVALRLYHLVHERWLVLDARRGWRMAEDLHRNVTRRDSAGRPYDVACTTNHDGFGAFADPDASRPRIFVIGDSFTQVGNASNAEMYFAFLGRTLDLEVFAYGCSGYGTLQEYMVLDEFYDRIKPDIVLWQLSSNDLLNNDYELELRSSGNNNGLRRPYLGADDRITYALPRRPVWLRGFANNYSHLLYFVFSRLDRLDAGRSDGVEAEIRQVGQRHAGLRRAMAITGKILRWGKIRCGSVRVLAFCVDDPSPEYEMLRTLTKDAGIEFIDGVPEAIRSAEQAGVVTRVSDRAHWNVEGNRICAERLADHLRTERPRSPGGA